MTTILISDNQGVIDEALSNGTIEIICAIGEDESLIIKNRTHIANGLIVNFLMQIVEELNPTQKLLNS